MPNAHALVHACENTKVAIARRGEQLKVIASESISKGQAVLTVEGRETVTPSMYSVQISSTLHVDLDDPTLVDRYPERYLWRFLNHHCRPNATLSGRTLVAINHIKAGDEVTFNYNANEYDMACPFDCWCDAHGVEAKREVRGYKHLSETERSLISAFAAPHVKALATEDA